MSAEISRRNFVAGAAGAAAISAAGIARVATAVADEGVTSDGIRTAEAVPSWLGEKPAIADSDVIKEADCEVLVCGSGMSGCFCASFAAEGGADVLWIESEASGAHMRSSGVSGVNTKYQEALGVHIDPEDILNDVVNIAQNQCSMKHWRDWVDHSAETVAWYGAMAERSGQYIRLEYSMPEEETRNKCWPTGHGLATIPQDECPTDPYEAGNFGGDETALWEVVLSDFEATGSTYRNNTRLIELTQDESGKVTGAYCEVEGGYLKVNASKGVVVATGGYVNNEEMFRALQPGFVNSCTGNLNWGINHGDGIKACLWAGADMDKAPANSTFDRGVVKPDYPMGGMFSGGDYRLFFFATQPFLKVNGNGKRLCNESSLYDYIIHAANKYPNYAWYPIWDSSWEEDVQRFHTIGCSTLFPRKGCNQGAAGLAAVKEQMDGMVEDGYIVKADTLEELAEGLGFEKDTFLAEVEKYNGWAAEGHDGEFGKDPFRLSLIDEPPFYGMKVGGVPLCTLDGIVVDDDYRALDKAGNVIEGLYVTGNDSGCNYMGSYPNQSAGTCSGRCAVNGMLVGKALATME